MNIKIIIIPVAVLIIGIGAFSFISSDEKNEISEDVKIMKSEEPRKLIQTNVPSLFKVMAYENDFEIIDGEKIWRDVFYELDPSNMMIYDELKNNKKSAVVFPIFTAAAYSEPGFYTFYRGDCDQEFHGVLFRDDDCLTVKLEEEYSPLFTSSANGLQVLNLLDYEIITDITIHQNPEILSQYEKIILLHNEYVTSEEFDAITSHPNVIYLYPNALYAEINFDEDLWEISLIRGHNYPDPLIRNGFDWKYDNSLEEYDVTCNDMKFSKIGNGWMLNCYPENVLHKSKELLKQIRDF
tara:strand:+ start:633 stop:1520 length:888 start_codon:yes stop_codon:yes gene_type:complete